MEIYKFKKEDAFSFANSVGAKVKIRGKELIFQRCPYCGNQTDSKNKFSINLETGQFNCFRASCGAKGNMITLSRDFDFTLSEEVDRYFNIRNVNGRFKQFTDAHRKFLSRPKAIQYLQSRGISEGICQKYEITTHKDNDEILVFPFKDENGELRFIKYRNTAFVKDKTKGSKEWCERDCMPILFGMAQCQDDVSLVITEGQIDSLSLAEAGIKNAVSVPTGANGFTWIPHCWDFLCKFKEIIIFGDCEKGIITLAEQIRARFPRNTRVVREEDYKGYKDANEILVNVGKEALIDAVNNAEFKGSTKLKDMSLVKRVDIENVETIRTGLKRLDEVLSGGFKVGTVDLLTGKAGNGKSTLASQFVVEALAQDYNCFIYSGELPNYFAKAWIDRQSTGKANPSQSDLDKSEAWYAKRLFIYDNNGEPDDIKGLLDTIEEAIIQKNCKLLLVDNLMTALAEVNNNDSLYTEQSNFVKSLAGMAKKYEVVIVLIAHPKKSNIEFNNDIISGSSNIVNLVDTVISYDRVGDKKDPDSDRDEVREVKVTKNRLTGKLGKFKAYYSEISKRISCTEGNFTKYYLPGSDDFTEIEKEEDIPF